MTIDEEISPLVKRILREDYGVKQGYDAIAYIGVSLASLAKLEKLAREDENKKPHCSNCFENGEKKEKEIQTLLAKQTKLENALSESQDILQEVLNQACSYGSSETVMDSQALSAYARGLRYMASVGRFRIEREVHRRVIGKWLAKGERTDKNKKALQEGEKSA